MRHWDILGIIPSLAMLVCVRGGCEGREQGSEPFYLLGSGTPAFAGFLHSSPSIKSPDSRKDLKTTYLEQVIAKPVFISLCVCTYVYHISIAF